MREQVSWGEDCGWAGGCVGCWLAWVRMPWLCMSGAPCTVLLCSPTHQRVLPICHPCHPGSVIGQARFKVHGKSTDGTTPPAPTLHSPDYMIGTPGVPGACVKTCDMCDTPGDKGDGSEDIPDVSDECRDLNENCE